MGVGGIEMLVVVFHILGREERDGIIFRVVVFWQ